MLGFLNVLAVKEALVIHPLVTVHFAHIPGTVVREYDHYIAIAVKFAFSIQLAYRLNRRTAGIPYKQAFTPGNLPGGMRAFLVGYLDELIDDTEI